MHLQPRPHRHCARTLRLSSSDHSQQFQRPRCKYQEIRHSESKPRRILIPTRSPIIHGPASDEIRQPAAQTQGEASEDYIRPPETPNGEPGWEKIVGLGAV